MCFMIHLTIWAQQSILTEATIAISIFDCETMQQFAYSVGEKIVLRAVATDSCSHFVKWSDNNTDNPRSVTVTQDSIFTAIFEKIQYNLSIDLNDTEHGDIEAKETNE